MEQRVGIGSKAPFAYTDTFTVINVYKNIKSVYIISKEPNQAPTIKTVYSDITDEPTGLKVSVVLKNDEYVFKNKITDFISKSDIKISLNGILQETNDFTNTYCFIKNESTICLEIYVKYNSVSYKLDLDNICISSMLKNIMRIYTKDFKFNTLILTTLPNTLDVSATRETLSYTKKTQDTLKNLINQFEKHITSYLLNNIKDVYKDIHTARDYFKYSKEMYEFNKNNNYISKDKEFLKYLVFYLTEIENQKLLKDILNISEHYRKILFSKIFNIKLKKLKRDNLIVSVINNLFFNIIYTNTWNGKKKQNYLYNTLPNKVYVVTNKLTPIKAENVNIKVPVLLTSLKNKNSLINKLTNFGIDCVFVSSPKKEKTIIKKEKDLIYAKVINSMHSYTYSKYNHLKLEPNSYIICNNRKSTLFNEVVLKYIEQISLKNNQKIYEIYYKKDFDLLLKEGHINIEKEIESEEFFKKHFNLTFLKKTYLNVSSFSLKHRFLQFINNNNDEVLELIKNKKWKLFFQKYRENIVSIAMYHDFINLFNEKRKNIIDTKNITAFNELINNKELKNMIDYKKLNQYILNGKTQQVIRLLELIKE